MKIKQQQDYVEIVKTMHLKIERLWGEGSKQEVAMKEILEKERDKLFFMLEERETHVKAAEQLLAKIFK
jgi:hypothetical protein